MKRVKIFSIQVIMALACFFLSQADSLYADTLSILKSFRQEFIQLVKDVEKTAVSIEAHMGVGEQLGSDPAIEMVNSGAGLVLDSNHIVAKQKIVQGSEHITITFFDKSQTKGTIIGSDNNLGLSIIRLDKAIREDFQPKTLVDPKLVAAGEPVLILSNSLGIMPAVSFGMVNCTRNDGMIQLSADLPAGTSGGAVFNFDGELIGLVAVEIDFFPDELPFSSDLLASETVLVNPIRDVKRLMTRVLARADDIKIYFGVAVEDWPSQLGGAHIKQVYQGSPAALSGIKTGDIVLSSNNHKVATAFDLFQIINSHNVGDNVKMQILRGDQIFPVSVTLTSPPATTTRITNVTSTTPEKTVTSSQQQRKINNEYLHKRIKMLETDLKILKEMIENN